MLGANPGIGAAGLGPSGMVPSWGRAGGTPLEGSPAAAGLLGQQVGLPGSSSTLIRPDPQPCAPSSSTAGPLHGGGGCGTAGADGGVLSFLAAQAHFEEHLQDTEVDAPMANLHLHNLQVCQMD